MSKLPFSVYDTFAYLASGLIVAVGVDYAFGLGLRDADLGVVEGLFGAVALYVLGHLVAHLAGAFLESVLVCRWLGRPEDWLFRERAKRPAGRVFRAYFRPFPEGTQRQLAEHAASEGMELTGRGFFYRCHGVAQREAVSRERLASFLNLYGFCRNASLAFLICAVVLVAGAVLVGAGMVVGDVSDRLWLAGGAVVASVGLFVRYLKFFRHYTTEVYLAFLTRTLDRSSSTSP